MEDDNELSHEEEERHYNEEAGNVDVQNENSFVHVLESKLEVGQVVNSVEDAYLLYCQYAHAKGFSTRKGDQRYFSHTNELQSKEFHCSCEGLKDEKCSSERIPIYQKPVIRTQCKAKLKITREKGCEWRVSRFFEEHNHEMFAPDQTHLLRSARNISRAKKFTLEAMVNAGISVSNAVSFMENESCGPQNLGFVRKDAYDHMSRLRKHTKVENGDANALIQYFINKANNENYFYWNIQLDDDDRLLNFFFRDYRCEVDYEYFGDVLSIDTAYRTNKYNLICAPFVGMNHHMQNVLFGLAFMSDETQSSFEWLFATFLDSMNGRQPQTIFSDQCQAMMNAIEISFPLSHHRLCQWHINQNAPSHFGSLNGDSAFKGLWYKCMNHCDSKDEFGSTWKYIETYDLYGHKWLNAMYKLKEKWSTAFMNRRFSAGLLATSRSEVTNMVLKKAGNKMSSLYDFVLNYAKIQNNWRERERTEDTRCRHGNPAQILKNHPLLIHATNVYTMSIYHLFEFELVNSLNCKSVEPPSCFGNDWNLIQIKVKSHDENSRVRHVVFHKQNHEINCSCHKFETMGILCKHALMRWTENARNRVTSNFDESGRDGTDHVSEVVFVNEIMRSTYDLAQRSKTNEEARKILYGLVDTAKDEISNLVSKLSVYDKTQCDDIGSDGVCIYNPLTAKAKGVTNVNITRNWDTKTKTRKGKRKEKTEISSAKGGKNRGESSQKTTDKREMSYGISSQHSNFTLSHFPSTFGHTQHFFQSPNQMEGNANSYLGDRMNLFSYQFGGPHSSQGRGN
ncbi:protein FAR1-RELATED SEQUENCE 5-like [Primulina eburnea]|uniref:protein FAR1-RELATED SEQUENCE 5-like n=1 Tax=Primulina eburnea TaxID=1245227 RepID=UPI003C6C3E3D